MRATRRSLSGDHARPVPADAGTGAPRAVRLSATGVGAAFALGALALAVAGLAVQWLRFEGTIDPKLVRFLSLDGEENLPALYGGLLLLVAAGLAALVAASAPRDGWRWATVSALLTFMTADEVFSIHERLIVPVRGWFDGALPALLHHAWIVPYLGLVAAVIVALGRFVLALEPVVRTPLLLAGTLYVGGAIGMEMLGGLLVAASGVTDSLPIHVVVVVEEALEMLGACVLIVALLRRIGSWPGPLVVEVGR